MSLAACHGFASVSLTEIGAEAGFGAVSTNSATGHGVVHEHHSAPVTQRRGQLDLRRRRFRHRQCPAGERGLLHLQSGRAQQPPAGRDPVTDLEQYDVPGHQFRGVQPDVAYSWRAPTESLRWCAAPRSGVRADGTLDQLAASRLGRLPASQANEADLSRRTAGLPHFRLRRRPRESLRPYPGTAPPPRGRRPGRARSVRHAGRRGRWSG
jgi:hypothetical protein